MPYLGRTSFLHRIRTKLEENTPSVNALSRAHFISTRSGRRRIVCLKQMCQCPISGALHFYRKNEMAAKTEKKCQCPISGALHFYCQSACSAEYYAVRVNALSRAHFISTKALETNLAAYVVCVNALSRAHFISTKKTVLQRNIVWNVSMPYLGRTSFLHAIYDYLMKKADVSMPYLGRTSFLRY